MMPPAAPCPPLASTEADRFPTLSAAGAAMLRFLREHPHAPLYRNASGNRLLPAELARVRAHAADTRARPLGWLQGQPPAWLEGFVTKVAEGVPHFRDNGARPEDEFITWPTTNRADLARDITRFVPDDVPVERLLHFQTSGTTGHPLSIPSHPIVAASYLAYHQRALARAGLELRAGAGEVGVVLLGHQRTCFTYTSVTPALDEAGLAKINLHPVDWRDPADRARYLDALAPEVIAGDPLSFAVLLELSVTHRPRAIFSTAMTLLPGLRARLEARFGCPVFDFYSLNEAGPVAVHDEARGGHVLLQPELYVEILDPHGQPVPPGQRGEITLTGGFNFCLPLLRYRTGDFAGLEEHGDELVLIGLEGRPPVRFRRADGGWLNNVEVTVALRSLALARFRLHQQADGTLLFAVEAGATDTAAARAALVTLFGPETLLDVTALPADLEGKVVQYTSDLREAAP